MVRVDEGGKFYGGYRIMRLFTVVPGPFGRSRNAIDTGVIGTGKSLVFRLAQVGRVRTGNRRSEQF